jgi:uncharacterized paraquat-inducible protein A
MTPPLMPTEPGRRARLHETYEITCFSCHCSVEIPAITLKGNIAICPRCGTALELRWSEAITG